MGASTKEYRVTEVTLSLTGRTFQSHLQKRKLSEKMLLRNI